MISLPNGCYCSGTPGDPKKGTPDMLSVFPENWNKPGASIASDWYIQYYFHDPKYNDHPKYKYGKLRIVKGMNKCKNLAERRQATKRLIQVELELLRDGLNPIANSVIPEIDSTVINEYEVLPTTFFYSALQKAYKQFNPGGSTKVDMDSMMGRLKIVIKELGFDMVPISQVSRKHINNIMTHLSVKYEKFSGHQHNKYRSYMMSLFKELFKVEAVQHNPMVQIEKRKTFRRMRLTLTQKEREKINKHLKPKYYTFWRLLQIYFHSGSRETEILSIKESDVDIERQRFMVLVKKGRGYSEQWRTIKNSVLYLWQEILSESQSGDYLFSRGLKPGKEKIRREQITRRWFEHVKDKLGIKADFASLKHSNLDETAALLSAQDAAKQAGHTTPVVTIKHYLVGEKERQHEKLKEVNNSF
jgi:integrase